MKPFHQPAKDFRLKATDYDLLLALPEDDCDVLLMRYRDGKAYSDIAKSLSIPPGTVRSRLHRTLTKLLAMRGSPPVTVDKQP